MLTLYGTLHLSGYYYSITFEFKSNAMKKLLALLLFTFTFLLSPVCYAQFQHPPGKYVEVNGYKLWVETEGKGDPLFLISGGPGGAHPGLHNFDKLKDSCTLVFIDNLGRANRTQLKT
jgi:proline iminopeptidase